MSKTKTLIKKIIIKGKITARTGLHIGGTNNELSIGGMDNAIIRNPVTLKPYIPGSSLKGKMRSLTELAHNTIGTKPMNRDVRNTPTNNPRHLAAQLFGYTQYKEEENEKEYDPQQPSRVIVRDCDLIEEEALAGVLVEEKAETVIDRITSAAMPRQMERVPAGAKFGMEIIINIFTGDSEKAFIEGVLNGMRLIRDDYLGGAGSRGSGQVAFEVNEIKGRPMDYYTTGDLSKEEGLVENFAQSFSDLITKKP